VNASWLRRGFRSALPVVLVLGACARGTTTEAPPPEEAAELLRLPAAAAAVVRVDVTGATGAAVQLALADPAAGRLECLAKLVPSLQRLAVGLVPHGRELAALLLLEGSLPRQEVEACGTELAHAFALRPLPEGAAPAIKPAPGRDAKEKGPGSWIVALDLDADREALGVTGPLAAAFSRLHAFPIVVAVGGGEALRAMSGMAATYLPLSSMGEAADRILALAYGILPLADGSASVRVEVDCVDEEAAQSLARQARLVGRIAGLEGEQAAWSELRGMLRDLRARVEGDGRRVVGEATLTPAGLRGILR